MSVYKYPVDKQWIKSLPKKAYRNGVGAYEGVVLHYTDNEGDTAQGEANYFAGGGWKNAFVHEFVDHRTVIQTADPNYSAWGAGSKANQRFIHIELCSAKNQAEFDQGYDAWCQRAAQYLYDRKLGVATAAGDGSGTLWSHHDVTHILGGTTHEDPIDHLMKFGKCWQDVIDRVSDIYNGLYYDEHPATTAPAPAPAPAPVPQPLDKEVAQTIIDTWMSPAYLATNDKQQQGYIRWLANELRKAAGIPLP